MDKVVVSVVMSVFNGERFLREAIDSILSQSFRDFEFVVIDDGSTDGSASILDSYQKHEPRLRVYRQGNRGLNKSLNRGVEVARGKYIARMDADDISLRDRLLWQVEFMEKHPTTGLLGGAFEFIDGEGRVLGSMNYPTEDRDLRPAILRQNLFQHPAVMMRKDAYEFVGGYRVAFTNAEDYDLWLRIADHFELANLESVIIRYRIHANQISQRHLRLQAGFALAAQASASSRREKKSDPLDSFEEITPEVLAKLGVSEAAVQQRVAAGYLFWIRNMASMGECAAALDLVDEMFRSSRWEHVKKWVIADVWLIAAGIHWRQRKYLASLRSGFRALVTRPLVAGRPLKRILQAIEHAGATAVHE